MNQHPKLTIALLVSNNIATIRDCMESIQPLLRAVPSELVVVDTVGETNSDGSLAVVREYTDRIYHFDWCGDFAAARNVGLSHAQGEWFMSLDDDEWFEDVTELIDFFQQGEYKKYAFGVYKVKNYLTEEGEYSMSNAGRMIRRTPQTKYVGRIHEALEPAMEPCKFFSCYVHHKGYLFHTEEERAAHIERNRKLLMQELEKEPANLHLRCQLSKELAFFAPTNMNAIEVIKDTLELCREQRKDLRYQREEILLLEAMEYEGLKAEALAKARSYLQEGVCFEATAAMYFNRTLIRLLIENGETAHIPAAADAYLLAWEEYKKHPEMNVKWRAFDFADAIGDEVFDWVLVCGANCALHQGDTAKAKCFMERIGTETYTSVTAKERLQKLIQIAKEYPVLGKLILEYLHRLMPR